MIPTREEPHVGWISGREAAAEEAQTGSAQRRSARIDWGYGHAQTDSRNRCLSGNGCRAQSKRG